MRARRPGRSGGQEAEGQCETRSQGKAASSLRGGARSLTSSHKGKKMNTELQRHSQNLYNRLAGRSLAELVATVGITEARTKKRANEAKVALDFARKAREAREKARVEYVEFFGYEIENIERRDSTTIIRCKVGAELFSTSYGFCVFTGGATKRPTFSSMTFRSSERRDAQLANLLQ